MKRRNLILSDDGKRAVCVDGKRVMTMSRRSTKQGYTWRNVYPVIVHDEVVANRVIRAWLDRGTIIMNPKPKPRFVWWQWFREARKV